MNRSEPRVQSRQCIGHPEQFPRERLAGNGTWIVVGDIDSSFLIRIRTIGIAATPPSPCNMANQLDSV